MINLLVVDDQLMFRKGVVGLINERENLRVVGEASDGEEAVAKALELRPDLILMDINMPKMTGIEATRQIKEQWPEARIVILTISDADDDLFEAIKAGARGYLLKNMRPETVFDLLEGVLRGEVPISPLMAAKILDEFGKSPRPAPTPALPPLTGVDDLTSREQEVLQMVVAGKSNREIAEQFGITEGTVKRHLHSILGKLHVRSRAQAMAQVLRRDQPTS